MHDGRPRAAARAAGGLAVEAAPDEVLPTVEPETAVDAKALRLEREAGEVYADIIEHFRDWKKHRKEQGDHDRISESAMCKMLDVAAKYRRIEIELMQPRLQREHVQRMMDHEREMAGLGRRGSEH